MDFENDIIIYVTVLTIDGQIMTIDKFRKTLDFV